LQRLKFTLVEPHAFAVEAFVYAHIAESDLFKLHSAFRALHVVKSALLLPLFFLHRCLTFVCLLPPALRFESGEVLLFGLTGLNGHTLLYTSRLI
jgi:hypothetical protein